MAHYHLYYLRDNKLIGGADIEATNDDEAVRLAKERGEGQAIEIWSAHARVRVVAPAKAPAPEPR
ncbi:MAG: hypothetical protein QOD42_675 [Sphingomonadales bacterium]|nr:hypothetical protein [Sphingomonadales bacterium]